MLNNVVLVGRIASGLEINEAENNRKVATMTLAIPRNYKNPDGTYDTDFIPCTLWNGIAENTAVYCKQGDLVGVKGRLQNKEGKIEIVAEKLTFLSSKPKEKED